MLRRFLTSEEEALLVAERRELANLRTPLANLEAKADDLALLNRALLQLDELDKPTLSIDVQCLFRQKGLDAQGDEKNIAHPQYHRPDERR